MLFRVFVGFLGVLVTSLISRMMAVTLSLMFSSFSSIIGMMLVRSPGMHGVSSRPKGK